MNDDAVLTIENLVVEVQPHFWSRRHRILDSVTLNVTAGEAFGFLGPNGSGKTTTIKALLGLTQPTSGHVALFGRSPMDADARRRVGFLPERSYFPMTLTARELVRAHAMLAGIARADARRRADRVLERVGLDRAAWDQRLATFSKGMLQRAGLAQAIVADPELVVLDEPMSGLDPLGRRDVRELMQSLRAEGKTVFFSTHILPDIETICDRVGLLVAGRVRKIAPLADLISEGVSGVEVAADGCSPNCLSATQPLAGSTRVQGSSANFLVDDVDGANRLIDALRQSGATVVGMQRHRRSLEEVFVTETSVEQRSDSQDSTPGVPA